MNEKQKVWFISDPHFGHGNIIKYEQRPFIDTEHMDNVIIENYNSVVGENDIVFWLGDMFFCKTGRMEYISQRLSKGRNILIIGNHDDRVSATKFKRLGFMPYKMYQWGCFILTHEPISEQNLNILKNYNIKANIHGHVHSQIEDYDPTKYCCVSVENTDYKPVNFSWIHERLTDGQAWVEWAKRRQRS